jgi:integrase
MKLADRQSVAGSSPKVYIGRRIYTDARGAEHVARVWYAECTHRGRTHYAPLKTASHSVAIHRAHQFSDKLRELGDAAPARPQVGLVELAREYMTYSLNRGNKPLTLGAYELMLSTFVAWAGQRFTGPAEQFSEKLFWEWNASMIADGYAAKTRHSRLTLIKQTFKWGAGRGKLLAVNPLADITLKEPAPTRQPCFDPSQVAALLEAADPLERAVFATLSYSGLRFGELRDLRWIDLLLPADSAGRVMVFGGGSDGTPKNRESRRVPLHPKLRRILEALPRLGEHVFYSPASKRNPRANRLLNESTWLARLKKLCERCGFENPQQYKLHTFRHFFASMCARNGVAYKYALSWLGHSSSEILDLYFTMFDDVADRAMRTLEFAPHSEPEPSPPGVPAVPFMRMAR